MGYVTEEVKSNIPPSLIRVLELYLENRVTMEEEERYFILSVIRFLIPAEALKKANLPIENDWLEKMKGKFRRKK